MPYIREIPAIWVAFVSVLGDSGMKVGGPPGTLWVLYTGNPENVLIL